MPDYIIQPSSKVTISDAPKTELPLPSFDLLILVEPDPETWMAQPGTSEVWGEIIANHNDAIEDEILDDGPVPNPPPVVPIALTTDLALLRYNDAYTFYDPLLEFWIHAVFLLTDYSDLEYFKLFLKGIASEHPDFRVAVIGAMLEEDVIRIANLVSETGLATTVITRYCLTRESFVNLDALDDYKSWLMNSGQDEELKSGL